MKCFHVIDERLCLAELLAIAHFTHEVLALNTLVEPLATWAHLAFVHKTGCAIDTCSLRLLCGHFLRSPLLEHVQQFGFHLPHGHLVCAGHLKSAVYMLHRPRRFPWGHFLQKYFLHPHDWHTGPHGTISVSLAPGRLSAALSAPNPHRLILLIASHQIWPRTFSIHFAHVAVW